MKKRVYRIIALAVTAYNAVLFLAMIFIFPNWIFEPEKRGITEILIGISAAVLLLVVWQRKKLDENSRNLLMVSYGITGLAALRWFMTLILI